MSAVHSDQRALMEETRAGLSEGEPSFTIALDETAGLFVASKDGVEFGGVLFTENDDRVLLISTSILPGYRGKGLASALTRRVLDMLHAEDKIVTVRCPVFRSFLTHHPDYATRLDPRATGEGRRNG